MILSKFCRSIVIERENNKNKIALVWAKFEIKEIQHCKLKGISDYNYDSMKLLFDH